MRPFDKVEELNSNTDNEDNQAIAKSIYRKYRIVGIILFTIGILGVIASLALLIYQTINLIQNKEFSIFQIIYVINVFIFGVFIFIGNYFIRFSKLIVINEKSTD